MRDYTSVVEHRGRCRFEIKTETALDAVHAAPFFHSAAYFEHFPVSLPLTAILPRAARLSPVGLSRGLPTLSATLGHLWLRPAFSSVRPQRWPTCAHVWSFVCQACPGQEGHRGCGLWPPPGTDRLLPGAASSGHSGLFCPGSHPSSWAILPFPFMLNQRGYFGKSCKQTKPRLALERIWKSPK